MKALIGFALCSVLSGCASTQDEATTVADNNKSGPESGSVDARVSTADATPKLAAAECEHEMRCKNVGEGLQFTSINECKRLKTEELTKDFNDDEDCRSGIPNSGLEACVAKTLEERCQGSVVAKVEVADACGSSDLCVK